MGRITYFVGFVCFCSLLNAIATLETASLSDYVCQHNNNLDTCKVNCQPTATTLDFNRSKFTITKAYNTLYIHMKFATHKEETPNFSRYTISQNSKPIIEGNWTKDAIERTKNFHIATNFLASPHIWKINIGLQQNDFSKEMFVSVVQHPIRSWKITCLESTDVSDNKAQISCVFSLGNRQPILSLSANYSEWVLGWKSQFLLESPIFNWHINGTASKNEDKKGEIRLDMEANNLDRPKKSPLQYRLRYSENQQSPFVDLRHKISSEFYTFEGNMTVTQGSENGSATTEIFQRTESSVWPFLNSNLHQVFHQSPNFSWEAVVMKSNLADMHVTGKWATSIWDYYRKLFQFRSHFELLPSVNVRLTYSERKKFVHEFHFLFLAKKLEFSVEFAEGDAIFPVQISTSFQDEFKSNVSALIMKVIITKADSYIRVDFDPKDQFWEIAKSVKEQLYQVWNLWKDASFDVNHPVNKLLSPVLNFEGSNFGLWMENLCNYVRQNFQYELDALLSLLN